MPKTQLSRKVLLSLAAVGAAASIAGLGTYATFTSDTRSSNTITAGTVAITLGSAGSSDNRLTISASGLVPGDTIQRRVKLTNGAGNENLASITLTTAVTGTPNILTTDATNGLQMKIEKCAGALGWRETGSGPYTYTCDAAVAADNAGTRTSVIAQRAIIGSGLGLSSLSSLTSGNTDDMVVTVTMPTSADNTFQTLSASIQYTFSGTQRAATDK